MDAGEVDLAVPWLRGYRQSRSAFSCLIVSQTWSQPSAQFSGPQINNGDLLQALALRLKLPPLLESGGSFWGWPPPSSVEETHSVVLLLPQLVQVSLHGNVMGPEMPSPGYGCDEFVHPVFYHLCLSSIIVGQYHYPQSALGMVQDFLPDWKSIRTSVMSQALREAILV